MGFTPLRYCESQSSYIATHANPSRSIDDIQDGSQLRRGRPVAHNIFGVAQTINAANYAYFQQQEKLNKIDDPRAFRIFTRELLNLHRGQGMDLYWRDALVCPTEEEYIQMVIYKTGGLFRLALELMQIQSTVTTYEPSKAFLFPIP
jgi:geranylgeranyl pyrophosphate synthase